MNQQPDKLFRDKLESFQTPAPSRAWNRIEAKLDKKNDKVLWFRIAASLLLVAIAVYLLWPANSADNVTPKSELADKTKKHETVSPQQKKEEPTVVSAPAQRNAIARKSLPRKHVVAKPKEVIEEKEQAPALQEEVTVADNTSAENDRENVEEIIPVTTETKATVVVSADNQKVKIIFSANDIDNKYLDKKALAEATSDDKKPSTLKKLLDKAYDLKYNQDPFGDLRQRKDEILALNFRKEKRSDNK